MRESLQGFKGAFRIPKYYKEFAASVYISAV